jgi:hypothetical protein
MDSLEFYEDDKSTYFYLRILGNFVEYKITDIYLDCEHLDGLNKKEIKRALWRRFATKDKIEYLEGVYNAVLQQLETPSNKRLTRFVDENINALQNKSFKISQKLFEDLRKSYRPLSGIFNPLNTAIQNENVTANTETNFKTYLFNLASESDKLFFVNEQNLFELIIHLYFKEKYLQWLIEVMDFVREDEKEVNENDNDKLRLWIDGVESKGNKKNSISFVNEPILSITKMNLKKGAKVDLIRIFVAMYDNGFFESETKQKVDLINVMKSLGDVLGMDLSDYQNNLSDAFNSKIETNLKVFDTLKQAIQKRYNKRLEK